MLPGLDFNILGGSRGHVPLHESSGTAVGELVAAGTLPRCIIDMAEFKTGGSQKFFVDFAEAPFKRMRGALHLVIEEAHGLPDQTSLLRPLVNLVSVAVPLLTAAVNHWITDNDLSVGRSVPAQIYIVSGAVAVVSLPETQTRQCPDRLSPLRRLASVRSDSHGM